MDMRDTLYSRLWHHFTGIFSGLKKKSKWKNEGKLQSAFYSSNAGKIEMKISVFIPQWMEGMLFA